MPFQTSWTSGLYYRNLFSHRPGDWKPKSKVLAGLVSSEHFCLACWWPYSPCVIMWFLLCVCLCPNLLLLQGPSHIGLRPTQVTSLTLITFLKTLCPDTVTFCSIGRLRFQHRNFRVSPCRPYSLFGGSRPEFHGRWRMVVRFLKRTSNSLSIRKGDTERPGSFPRSWFRHRFAANVAMTAAWS